MNNHYDFMANLSSTVVVRFPVSKHYKLERNAQCQLDRYAIIGRTFTYEDLDRNFNHLAVKAESLDTLVPACNVLNTFRPTFTARDHSCYHVLPDNGYFRIFAVFTLAEGDVDVCTQTDYPLTIGSLYEAVTDDAFFAKTVYDCWRQDVKNLPIDETVAAYMVGRDFGEQFRWKGTIYDWCEKEDAPADSDAVVEVFCPDGGTFFTRRALTKHLPAEAIKHYFNGWVEAFLFDMEGVTASLASDAEAVLKKITDATVATDASARSGSKVEIKHEAQSALKVNNWLEKFKHMASPLVMGLSLFLSGCGFISGADPFTSTAFAWSDSEDIPYPRPVYAEDQFTIVGEAWQEQLRAERADGVPLYADGDVHLSRRECQEAIRGPMQYWHREMKEARAQHRPTFWKSYQLTCERVTLTSPNPNRFAASHPFPKDTPTPVEKDDPAWD